LPTGSLISSHVEPCSLHGALADPDSAEGEEPVGLGLDVGDLDVEALPVLHRLRLRCPLQEELRAGAPFGNSAT
jgi:hypothetical protein